MNPALLILTLLASWSPGQVSPRNAYDHIQSLIATKQFDAAENLLVARLVDQPRNADLITYLAEVKINQGHPAEASRLVANAETIGGVTAVREQIAGLAESAEGHLGPAESHFRRAIELDPKFVPGHYFLARLLYTRNRFDDAIQESKTTITLSPDFVRAYENLGLCYEGKDDSKQAEQWYREAIVHDSESVSKTEWPQLDLATLLIREDRIEEARPFMGQALSINPNNAQSHLQMGILFEKAGDPKRSLDELRTAIKLNMNLATALYRAARVCKKLGREEEAQRYFEEYRRVTEKKP
jgi:tetratricopeptide (TPR) repeat protein